ncbi:MAG: zf-HC2 domain-containing protein, partial [Acidobacteria bacterium]|nr:zf-HC2 domain-containing protein [Acidobacteriota bacterium]
MRNAVTCEETQEYLQEFMDASLAPEKEGRLRAHLESCPACAGELQLQREIRKRVAAEVPRREAPPDLTRRVQEILTPRPGGVRRLLPRPALRWGLAVATLVLLSLIPLALLERGPLLRQFAAIIRNHSIVMPSDLTLMFKALITME